MGMKFSATALSVLASAAKAQEDRALATLAVKWSIADPAFAFEGLDFTFDYPVSNFVDQGQAYYEVYDSGCKEGGNLVTTGFTLSSIFDVTAGSVTDDATFDIAGKTAQVPISVETSDITSNTDVYTETDTDGAVGASIVFCVRFGLNTLGDSPVEVNFLESVVTLNVDLSAGFAIDDINVTPKDQLINTAAQAYTVEGYMCNPGTDTPVADATTALNQGSLISVCIKPDADGISDGIKMRSVDSFEWTRDATTQTAIENSVAAGNLLTSFDETACAGGDYCQFSSILFAAFYASKGQVFGNGVASMQFGTRRLSEGSGLRALQEQDAAATSEFDLAVQLEAADDGPAALQTAAGASVDTMLCAVLASVAVVHYYKSMQLSIRPTSKSKRTE